MATDSGELTIQILKRQGKKETGKDFKENFEFLIKDSMNEKVKVLDEISNS